MTRILPVAVLDQVRPVPDDFTPIFEAPDARYLRWSEIVEVKDHGLVHLELGYHIRKGHEVPSGVALRAAAWQAMELARLGRVDLLSHARVDRHKARKQA